MSSDSRPPPVIVEIRQQLLSGIEADRPRSSLLAGATVAVLAIVAAAAVLFSSFATGAAAAYTIQTDDSGRVVVEMVPEIDVLDRDALDELEVELAGRGLTVEVVTIASAPSLAGVIEVVARSGTTDGLDVGVGQFSIDPARFDGSVEILVYVAAPADGRIVQSPSAFHPDERLGGLPCATGGSVSVDRLRTVATEQGLTVDWYVSSPLTPDELERDMVVVDEPPTGWVVMAWMISGDRLAATVWPADTVDEPPPASMTDGLHSGFAEPSCTPALAQRWPTQG